MHASLGLRASRSKIVAVGRSASRSVSHITDSKSWLIGVTSCQPDTSQSPPRARVRCHLTVRNGRVTIAVVDTGPITSWIRFPASMSAPGPPPQTASPKADRHHLQRALSLHPQRRISGCDVNSTLVALLTIASARNALQSATPHSRGVSCHGHLPGERPSRRGPLPKTQRPPIEPVRTRALSDLHRSPSSASITEAPALGMLRPTRTGDPRQPAHCRNLLTFRSGEGSRRSMSSPSFSIGLLVRPIAASSPSRRFASSAPRGCLPAARPRRSNRPVLRVRSTIARRVRIQAQMLPCRRRQETAPHSPAHRTVPGNHPLQHGVSTLQIREGAVARTVAVRRQNLDQRAHLRHALVASQNDHPTPPRR